MAPGNFLLARAPSRHDVALDMCLIHGRTTTGDSSWHESQQLANADDTKKRHRWHDSRFNPRLLSRGLKRESCHRCLFFVSSAFASCWLSCHDESPVVVRPWIRHISRATSCLEGALASKKLPGAMRRACLYVLGS